MAKRDLLTDSRALRAVAETSRRKSGGAYKTTPTFDFTTEAVKQGEPSRFIMAFQMRSSKLPDGTRVPHKRQGVRIPATLMAALEARVPENTIAALVGLADWALQRMEEERITVTAHQTQYTGVAVAPKEPVKAKTRAKPKAKAATKKAPAKKATAKKVVAKKARVGAKAR